MMHKAVLLDTSFPIRFLNEDDPLFKNADGYFRHFIQQETTMMISTISIAEYCAGGDIHELPLRNLQILPFNLNHSKRAGEFAQTIFRNKNKLKINERNLIPNDTKLFAQADCEHTISLYLSSDYESLKIYRLLLELNPPKFQFLHLSTPPNEAFGLLELE